MFRVLLREIEDLCSFPHLTFQALQNCKQKGTVWKIRDCCCFLEVSLVYVLYYNRECSWKPVLPSIVCVLHSHGFTWLESKYFCWHFATLIEELLKINSLSKGSVVKLHTLAFVVVKFRDAVSIYSKVEVRIEQVQKLKTSYQHTPGSLTSDAWA